VVVLGGKPWTAEEVEILKKYYPNKKSEEIRTFLKGRTTGGIRSFAKRLDLRKDDKFRKRVLQSMWVEARKPRSWRENEVEILKFHYPIKTHVELSKMVPTHSIEAINVKANSMGLKKDKRVISRYRRRKRPKFVRAGMWTDEELDILKNKYPNTPNSELLKILDRPINSIYAKAGELGLKKKNRILGRKREAPLYWTEEEITCLRKIYPTEAKEKILSILSKRSWGGIQKKAWKYKIKRNKSIIEKRLISYGEFNPASWVQSKPTGPEKRLMEIIAKNEFPFLYVGNGAYQVGGLTPDFIFCNKIIEVFGRVFHDPDRTFKKEVPYYQQYLGRIDFFKNHGYDCLILWDDELNNEGAVVNRIGLFMGDA